MKSFLDGRPQASASKAEKSTATTTPMPTRPAHGSGKPTASNAFTASLPNHQAGAGGASFAGGMKGALGAHGHGHGADHGAPEIECIRDGDRIISILIRCSCGERIEIDCVYPEGV
jgi:hypothetical protein